MRTTQEFLGACNAVQLVTEPTRVSQHSASLLDLIITSAGSLIARSGVLPCDLSDHDIVYCDLKLNNNISQPKIIYSRFLQNINTNDISLDLRSLPLQNILRLGNVNEKVHFFNTLILQLFDIHAPVRAKRVTKVCKPWITPNIKLLMKERDRAKTMYRRERGDTHWRTYKDLRNFTTTCIRSEKKAYFEHLTRTSKPETIWRSLKMFDIYSRPAGELPVELRNIERMNEFFINSVPSYDTVTDFSYPDCPSACDRFEMVMVDE